MTNLPALIDRVASMMRAAKAAAVRKRLKKRENALNMPTAFSPEECPLIWRSRRRNARRLDAKARRIWEQGPLGRRHDRNAFDCGEDDLDACLKRYARRNPESGGAKCFVAAPPRFVIYLRARSIERSTREGPALPRRHLALIYAVFPAIG